MDNYEAAIRFEATIKESSSCSKHSTGYKNTV